MRVLFLANPGPYDTPRGEHYEAGQVYDLTPDRAHKWMAIVGIAVEAPAEPEPEPPWQPDATPIPVPLGREAPQPHQAVSAGRSRDDGFPTDKSVGVPASPSVANGGPSDLVPSGPPDESPSAPEGTGDRPKGRRG